MTDFLSKLLDRARDSAQVLRPRRPSVFEPVPDKRGPGVTPTRRLARIGLEEEVVEIEAEINRDAGTRRAARVSPRVPAARSETPASDETAGLASIRSRDSVRPPSRSMPGEHRDAQAVPTARVPRRVVTPNADEEQPYRAPEIRRRAEVAARPEVVETSTEPDVSQLRPVIRPAQRTPEQPESPSPIAPPAPVRRAPVPAVETRFSERKETPNEERPQGISEVAAAAPAPRAHVVPVPRRRPSLLSAPPPSPVSPPAPTVEVTIGRIEVRAVPAKPEARGRVQGSAAPKLSLEDYLSARGGESS